MTLKDGIANSLSADDADAVQPIRALSYEIDPATGKWGPRVAGGSGGTGGASANLTTLSMVTMTMDGSSKPLPAAPAGASALQIQPQSGDVRVTLDSSAASNTNGLIYYEGGLYDHPYVDRAATRLYGVAGVNVVLIWKGTA